MDYRANINRVLGQATTDEIRDGLAFYAEFHGVARVLAGIYQLPSVAHGAGILAALSPMNVWDDNVSDAFSISCWARDTPDDPVPKVRTTNPNRDKAACIAKGRHPEHVLQGRKVRAFYLCTAAPEAGCVIAVDRHLACIAAGKVLDDHGITSLLSRQYGEIESTYMEMAASERLMGHQLASVAWFAWRRMKSQSSIGQHLLPACA